MAVREKFVRSFFGRAMAVREKLSVRSCLVRSCEKFVREKLREKLSCAGDNNLTVEF